MKNKLVSLETMQSAYPAVKSIVHHTPMMTCTNLTEKCGLQPGQLLLKMENLQRTGSFKIRGAYHRISSLSEAEKAAGVVAASAGNHAQGLAYHSKRLGLPQAITHRAWRLRQN